MSENKAILEKLIQIVANVMPQTDLSSITEETRLMEDLGLGSMNLLVLMLEIESEYGFEFTGEETFTTVGDVIAYIIQRKA